MSNNTNASDNKILLNKLSAFDLSLFLLICSIFLTTNSTVRVVFELLFFGFAMLYVIIGVRPVGKKYIVWSIMFLLYCSLAFFYADHKEMVLYGIRGVLEVSLIGIGMYVYLSRNDWEANINKTIAFLKITSVLMAIYTFATVPINNIVFSRMSNSVLNANEMAVKWAFSSILVYFSLKNKEQTLHFSDYLYFLFIAMMVLFTGSKKGLLILIMGVALIFLIYSKKRDRLFSLVVVGLVISVLLYMIFNNPQLYAIIGWRVEALFNPEMDTDSSTRIRREMIQFGMAMFQNNKMVGYGINTFQDYSMFGTYAHNNFVELLFDTGIIGTVIYYSLHASILIKLLLKHRYMRNSTKFYGFMFIIMLLCDYGMVSYGNEFMVMIVSFLTFGFVSSQLYLEQ